MINLGLGCVAVAALLWLQLHVVATPAHLNSRWTWVTLGGADAAGPDERDCRSVYTVLMRGFIAAAALFVLVGVSPAGPRLPPRTRQTSSAQPDSGRPGVRRSR